jgi:hypothetical protein
MSSWARKVAEADASAGGNYITKHGRYLMACEEMKIKDGFKGESLINILRVLEAEPNGNTDPVVGTHKVGDRLSVVMNFKSDVMAEGKAKTLILEYLGKKEAQVSDDQFEALATAVVGPEQPLTGKTIRCETFEFTTKDQKKGCGQGWQHVPQSTEDQKAQRTKILGG